MTDVWFFCDSQLNAEVTLRSKPRRPCVDSTNKRARRSEHLYSRCFGDFVDTGRLMTVSKSFRVSAGWFFINNLDCFHIRLFSDWLFQLRHSLASLPSFMKLFSVLPSFPSARVRLHPLLPGQPTHSPLAAVWVDSRSMQQLTERRSSIKPQQPVS